MSAITVSGLVKRYGRHTAVDGLDLTIEAGTTYALLGPNGAGKTTTVEILEGLRSRDAGEVSVLDIDPAHEPVRLHSRVGVMLQEGGIFPGAKVGETLELFTAIHRNVVHPRDLAMLVGIADITGTLVRRLSGGQRQRLSLAVALAGRPELVFLDEPTAGMDPAARRATWEIISDLRRDGVTVVLTTHLLDEAERLADRVGIVTHGRLRAEGTPAELVAAAGRVRFATHSPPAAGTLDELGWAVRATGERHFEVDVDATPAVMARIAAWAETHDVLLTELRAGASGLEEAFLAITDEAAP